MTSNLRNAVATTTLLVALTGVMGLAAPVSLPVGAGVLVTLGLIAAVSPPGALAAVVVALPYFYRPIGVGSLEFAASELLLAATAAGALLRIAFYVQQDTLSPEDLLVRWRELLQSRLIQILLIVTLAGAVTLFALYEPSARDASMREWRWTLAEPFLFLGLLIVFCRTRRSRTLLACSLLAAGTIAAGHGLLDVFNGGGVTADNVRRLSGPLPHPNALALFLVKPFVFGATLVVVAPRWRLFLIPPVALTGIALFGTFSRGAMIAVFFAVVLVALHSGRMLKIALAGAALVAGAFAFLVAGDRMSNALEGGSVSLRLDIWRSALAMIRDSPIVGYGPDQFLYAYAPRYIQATAWDERFTSHAHNLIADSWIRLGLIGAVVALVALISVARRLTKVRLTNHGSFPVRDAAIVALGATLVHGMIDNAYFGHDLAMSTWLIGWLAFSNLQGDEEGHTSHG